MVAPNSVTGSLKILTDVTTEPISLAEAWYQCRLDPEGSPLEHYDDTYLSTIAIPAVRDYAERFTGQTLAPKSYELTIDAFAAEIYLPVPPLTAVSAIKYDDEDGNEQTLDGATYVVEMATDATMMHNSHIRLAEDQSWPTTDSTAGAIRIEFTAGYVAADLPVAIKQGMLLMLGHIYKNRESTFDKESFVMPFGVESFLRPYRVRLGMA